MRFANLFLKPGAIEKANATYRARIAEIDAKSADQAQVISSKREANKRTFQESIAKATADRNAKLAESKRTGKIVL